MTMKEALAHDVQRRLQSRTAIDIKRSHVYELLAAALGSSSWAAFLSDSLLADAGVGEPPEEAVPKVTGRAIQLGFDQAAAAGIAEALLDFTASRQLGRVRWTELLTLRAEPKAPDPVEEWDDEEIDLDDDELPAGDQAAVESPDDVRQRLLGSPLLLDGLDEEGKGLTAERHHAVAGLYRCARPNSYLFEESLKGRVLTGIERGWVDDYQRMEPRFRRYEQHLKVAAHGGVRDAAVECAAVFSKYEFFDLAERLAGPVNAERMAELATTTEARQRWLQVAAGQGSEAALWHMANTGDKAALERLAELGDMRALQRVLEEAIDSGDTLRAWTWQYLALEYGKDFTESSMRAYHDGGSQDGQFYDSDFGGAMFVDGDEAVDLPDISAAEHEMVRKEARRVYGRVQAGG